MALRASSWLLLMLLAGTLGGCAVATPKTNAFLVSANATEFYKYGPAQAFGADSSLPRGTKVTMLKHDFGYSQVQLTDGTTGFLATEDVKPAPAPPPIKPSRTHATPRRAASRSSHVSPTPGDPLFDVTDIPLPLPAGPETPKPKP